MRGIGGKPGWFWLFLLEGLLTVIIGAIVCPHLSPDCGACSERLTYAICTNRAISTFHTHPHVHRGLSGVNRGTRNARKLLWSMCVLFSKSRYRAFFLTITQRLLRDDPAKGLTALKEPARLKDILNAWRDPSMWGLYFVGLVAYIPATPVQAYLSLTLKRIGFSTFNANLLSIPSAVLQIILMLILAYSSEYFGERTFHCFFGEFWLLPLLAALITLPSGGRNWARFTITTMISGCEFPLA